MEKYLSFRIVIPSFNQGQYLRETLNSVVSQNYPGKVQIAVLDGGSTDNSLRVIREFADKIDYWRSHKDDGQAASLVEGFDTLTGEISFYLNSDDVLLPGTLSKVNRFFLQDANLGFLYSNRVIINEESEVVGYWKLPKHRKEIIRQSDVIPQETLFWRTSLMDEIGNFDPKLHFAMDYDFIFRLLEVSKGTRVNEFLSAFRYHQESKTHNLLNSLGNEEILMLKKKYGVKKFPFASEFISLSVRIFTFCWIISQKFNKKKIHEGNLAKIWGWPAREKISSMKGSEGNYRKLHVMKMKERLDNIFHRNRYQLYSILVAVVAAILALGFSYIKGRLTQQLTYDDVTYIIDAGSRLNIGSFFKHFIDNPPHSPFDTALASIGLKLFGFHDYSSYILGAFVLALLVSFFSFSLKVSKKHSFFITLILSTSSIGYFGFTEFRPDIANALITASGLVFLLRREVSPKLGIGLLLLALWIKPSFFPQTLVLALITLCLRYSIVKKDLAKQEWKRFSNIFLVTGLLLSVSYYSHAFQQTLDYFKLGAMTQRSVWSFPDSLSNLGAYLWYSGIQRNSATVVLGSIMSVSIIYSTFSLIHTIIKHRGFRLNDSSFHIWILGFISLSIVALGRIPNHFFGATAALLFFASSMDYLAKSRWAKALLVLFFIFSIGMASQTLRSVSSSYPSRDASRTNPASILIFQGMKNNSLTQLYIPFQGQVNAVTLAWENMKVKGHLLFDDSSVMPTIEQSTKRADEMGAILCPKKTADYYTYLPSAVTTNVLCNSKTRSSNWEKIDLKNNYYIVRRVK